MKVLREHDRVVVERTEPLDLEPYIGVWEKTNEKPGQWIRRVEITPEGAGNIALHLYGGDDPSPSDWGTSTADALFASSITSSTGMGFIARYDFGFLQSEMQGNVNLGLLVLAGFNRFRDGSGRSDIFTREFFHRVEQ